MLSRGEKMEEILLGSKIEAGQLNMGLVPHSFLFGDFAY